MHIPTNFFARSLVVTAAVLAATVMTWDLRPDFPNLPNFKFSAGISLSIEEAADNDLPTASPTVAEQSTKLGETDKGKSCNPWCMAYGTENQKEVCLPFDHGYVKSTRMGYTCADLDAQNVEATRNTRMHTTCLIYEGMPHNSKCLMRAEFPEPCTSYCSGFGTPSEQNICDPNLNITENTQNIPFVGFTCYGRELLERKKVEKLRIRCVVNDIKSDRRCLELWTTGKLRNRKTQIDSNIKALRASSLILFSIELDSFYGGLVEAGLLPSDFGVSDNEVLRWRRKATISHYLLRYDSTARIDDAMVNAGAPCDSKFMRCPHRGNDAPTDENHISYKCWDEDGDRRHEYCWFSNDDTSGDDDGDDDGSSSLNCNKVNDQGKVAICHRPSGNPDFQMETLVSQETCEEHKRWGRDVNAPC